MHISTGAKPLTQLFQAQSAPTQNSTGPQDGHSGQVAVGALGTIPRPAKIGSGWSEDSLDASAADFVKNLASQEDSVVGSLDANNCGLTAYVVAPDKAEAVLSAGKEMYPGSQEFQALSYNPAQQRLLGVLVSEDEPQLYLCVQNRADGQCTLSDSLGFVGGGCCDTLSPQTAETLVPEASGKDREDDWEFLTGALTGAKPLDLGSEAGQPFWWQ